MKYSQLLERLRAEQESEFAAFQRRLIPTQQTILGVRTPTLRKIANEWKDCVDELFSFPDEFYEVTFIKLAVVAKLDYPRFLFYLEDCVAKIDNWATCDCFKAKCLQNNTDGFLPVLEKIFQNGEEFSHRLVLVKLLSFYVQEKYLSIIKYYLLRAATSKYYVHMAAAWLTAEILIKYYDTGTAILKDGILERKTHNKAIQKAIESYRLTKEQKEFLRSLKK